MPLTTQVLAECERIDERVSYIRQLLAFGGMGNRHSLPYGGGDEIIAELETYKVLLGNILGDTNKKEQDHLLRSPVIVHESWTMIFRLLF